MHKPAGTQSAAMKEAIAFIYSPDNMQQVAFGSTDIKLSTGEILTVPATMRTICREKIYEDYARKRRDPRGKRWFGAKDAPGSFRYSGLGRSKFLEAAELAAKGDLKQLGALDVVSEVCGRMQFDQLRVIVRDLAQLCPEACGGMLDAVLQHVDAVEIHIKRDLKAHLNHADASACVWHCRNHAHADPESCDCSRPAVCEHEHTIGCAECALLSALQHDMRIMLHAAELQLRRALPPQQTGELVVGSYVTFTDEAGVAHVSTIREVIAAAAGATADTAPAASFMVDVGFEGALRLAPAAALTPRPSEPRLEKITQLRELARRSCEKLDTYYSHMVRAAHEAATMSRLLDELDDDEALVVADWKMKFLMSCFREAMSDFFGKRGMPWHGCMLIRKPLRFERAKYGEGEFVCEYKHAMMLGSKEDGFATLSAVHVALAEYKVENPHISRATLKTDGAAAYAGATFALGLPYLIQTTGIRVEGHFIGEAGQNKSTLDGEFAVSGNMLRRLICSGAHDVRTPDDLFAGLKKVLRGGRTVALFQTADGAAFEAAAIAGLTLMSHRTYEYEDDDFSAIVLRRQSFLGEGQRMTLEELFPDGRRAPRPAAPVVLATTSNGAAGTSLGDKLKARSDAGRQAKKKAKEERKQTTIQKLEAARQELVKELEERHKGSRLYRCRFEEGGTAGCDRVFVRRSEFLKHVQKGTTDPTVHRTGLVRPYAAGAAVGSDNAADSMRRLIAEQAQTLTRHGGEGGSAVPTLCEVCDLQLPLCDGSMLQPEPPTSGFAGSTQHRAAARSKSARQLEYCRLVSHEIKANDYENLHGHEASKQMLRWGTPAFAARYTRTPIAATSASGQPYLPRTAQLSHSELTPLLMLKREDIDKRIAKARAKERRPWKVAGRKRKQADGGAARGAARGAADGAAAKRAKPSPQAVLCAARRKLRDASWDIVAAVGETGGKRSDRLTVTEMLALAHHRGWTLAKEERANKAAVVNFLVAKREEARQGAAAAAGHPGDPDSDDGLAECWGAHPDDYSDGIAPADDNAAEEGDADGGAGEQAGGEEAGGEEAEGDESEGDAAVADLGDEPVEMEGEPAEDGGAMSSASSSSDSDSSEDASAEENVEEGAVRALKALVLKRRGIAPELGEDEPAFAEEESSSSSESEDA